MKKTRGRKSNRAPKHPDEFFAFDGRDIVSCTVEVVRVSPTENKVRIDLGSLSKLAEIGCTFREMAYFFGLTEDSFTRVRKTYSQVRYTIERATEQRNINLRRKQYERAMAGDRAMLIWLGKQWLGQKENPDQEQSNNYSLSISLADGGTMIAQNGSDVVESLRRRFNVNDPAVENADADVDGD